MVVASNPGLIAQFGFTPPVPCSIHAARGRDGADRVLLAAAAPEWVARRFARLVIASGDAAFVDLARAVRALGVAVVVVARAEGLAGRLRRAGCSVVEFDAGLPDAHRVVEAA